MKVIGAILAVASTLFTGCASGPAKTYQGEQGVQSVALLKGIPSERYLTDFSSYAEVIEGREPEPKSLRRFLEGSPRELQMLPGKYMVKALCSGVVTQAFPSTIVDVEAGWTYEMQCAEVPENPRYARLDIVRKYKTTGVP